MRKLLASIAMIALVSGSASAATCTSTLTRGVSVPTGFGAAFNVDSTGTADTFISPAGCVPGATQSTVTVNIGAAGLYVYKTAYYWANNQWNALNLTGSGLDQNYFSGVASVAVPITAGKAYINVIGFVCLTGGVRCGCRDTTCATPYWSLQKITVQ